jgi:hypothetical protein
MKLKLLQKSFPLLLGTWVLRSTNDNSISNGISYMIINYDDTIKFRTLNQEGIFGTKISTSGKILNVTDFNNTEYFVDLLYSQSNKYSYSLLGVEIPEFRSETKNYLIKKKLNITLYDKSILVKDDKKSLYYLFDLSIGRFKQPFIETGLNTYIFTQTISILLNLFLAKILHNIFFN